MFHNQRKQTTSKIFSLDFLPMLFAQSSGGKWSRGTAYTFPLRHVNAITKFASTRGSGNVHAYLRETLVKCCAWGNYSAITNTIIIMSNFACVLCSGVVTPAHTLPLSHAQMNVQRVIFPTWKSSRIRGGRNPEHESCYLPSLIRVIDPFLLKVNWIQKLRSCYLILSIRLFFMFLCCLS